MSPFEASPMPEAIRREIESLRSGLRTGFEALNDRLDATNDHLKELNGRTRTSEENIARHDERLKTLFESDRKRDADTSHDDDDRRLTQRDVRLVIAGVLGTTAVLSFFWKVLPAMLKALAP